MTPYIKRKILKKQDNSFEEIEDHIAVEKRLRISVNGKDFVSLYCTPLMIRELVAGFFLTERILDGRFCLDEIMIRDGAEEIAADIPARGEVGTEGLTLTSGCVGGITFNKKRGVEKISDMFSIKAAAVEALFNEFQKMGELYRLTGCVHSAALSDGAKILVFAEDIGRHNAVDKVIGYAILEEIPFTRKIMLVSGRLSSEIAAKCSRWGIPVLASRTAPTDLAIKIAEESGVALIGFVRGKRMNIYTNKHRILI
jgi:FdhD protein